MPIFEYQCLKCGHEFETLVLGKEKIICPKCKSNKVKKLISAGHVGSNSTSESSCPTCSTRGDGSCKL